MDWWTPEQAGMIGGYGGAIFGGVLLGAIGGGVCGPLAGTGKARSFVIGYATIMGVISAIILAAGAWSIIDGQPWHVWFPLIQMGGMGVFFGFGGRIMFGKIYRKHEQRTLAAEEFRRS